MLKRTVEGENLIYTDNGKQVLSIRETSEEGFVLMVVQGDLVSGVDHDLQDELFALIMADARVVVDMSGVTDLSSAVQHVFLSTQLKVDSTGKGRLTLKKVPEVIYREFEMVGDADLLEFEN